MSQLKRYQDPELYERLAAEYVLGTLRGGALRRFEQLIQERPYIRYAVELWEEKLNPLIETAPEVKPRAEVWQGIKSEIHLDARHGAEQGGAVEAGFLARLFGGRAIWQATTAVLASLLFVSWWVPQLPMPGAPGAAMPMPSYVAVLESEQKKPMIVTVGDKDRRMIMVRVLEKPPMGDERELALWALNEPGSAPVPLGVVPFNEEHSALKFTRQEWQRFKGAKEFAVTMEPKSEDMPAAPTGPVMYKGACLDFI